MLSEELDVANETSVNALFDNLKAQNLVVDVLINNAGVNLSRAKVVDSVVEDWWNTVVGAHILVQPF